MKTLLEPLYLLQEQNLPGSCSKIVKFRVSAGLADSDISPEIFASRGLGLATFVPDKDLVSLG